VHVVPLQAVPDAHTTPPGHIVVVVGVTQVPAPSHAGAPLRSAFAHDGDPQLVLATANRQAPLPSHVPSWPQIMVLSTAHFPADEPPALIGLQSPLAWPVSAFAQERQSPVHALSQQIPPTHWPWTHSLLAAQVEPSIFFAVHVPVAAQ